MDKATIPRAKPRSMRLTAIAVERMKPENKRYEVVDTISGVRLVVQPSGSRSWCVRYRYGKRPKKYTIPGAYPKVGLNEARTLAREAFAAVAGGKDPAHEKASARQDSVEAAVEEFLERHVRKNCRPRTVAG